MASTITATVTKRPKWAFQVLAVAGGKVEVFDDYTFAGRWTQSLGGGVVYPREAVSDYTPTSVMLKDGMKLAEPEPTIEELAAEVSAQFWGS